MRCVRSAREPLALLLSFCQPYGAYSHLTANQSINARAAADTNVRGQMSGRLFVKFIVRVRPVRRLNLKPIIALNCYGSRPR